MAGKAPIDLAFYNRNSSVPTTNSPGVGSSATPARNGPLRKPWHGCGKAP